jgi:hypothetical protein
MDGAPVGPQPPAPGRFGKVLPASILAGCLALFFAPALLGPGQFLYRDSGRMHYPVKRFIAGELARGHLPLWNPFNGMGTPLVAGGADAVQHPFNLLLVALPFDLGFKLWVLLSYVLAAAGAFLWARQLGRTWQGATLGALAFTLSGYLVSSSDNLTYLTTFAATPLVLAAAHAFVSGGGMGRLALVGLAAALMASGGDPVAWALVTATLPLYSALVVAEPGGRLRAAVRGLAAVAASLVGSAPFVFPVLAWLPHSTRGEGLDAAELLRWNLAPARLSELALPYAYRSDPGDLTSNVFMVYGGDGGNTLPWVISIYVGAAVCALAVSGAVVDRRARVLVVAAVFVTWMAMGHYGGFSRLVQGIPFVSSIRYGEKLVAWVGLLLAAAAASGFDALARAELAGRLGAGALATGLVLVGWHGMGLEPHLGRAPPAEIAGLVGGGASAQAAHQLATNLERGMLHGGLVLVLLGGAALLSRRRRSGAWGLGVVGVITVLDLFVANQRAYVLERPLPPAHESPVVARLEATPGAHRVITPANPLHLYPGLTLMDSTLQYCSRTLYPETNTAARIGNFEPYAGMLPARTSRFLRRAGGIQGAARRVGLWAVEAAVIPLGAEAAPRWGVTQPARTVAYEREVATTLVGLTHRPLAYLAGALTSVDRRNAMEFALAADEATASSTASVVEAAVPEDYRPPGGIARILRYDPEQVEVETRAELRALLVLNDIFAEGWSATVDGRPAAILPANYLARGVWVEPGEHRVTFTYRAAGLGSGWAVFGLGAVSALAAFARRRRASAG